MSGVWRRLDGAAASVDVTVDGRAVKAFADETVATLLLRLGLDHFGPHPKGDAALAPYCLMGTCFGCLCTIDDRPGSQACLEPVIDGLEIVTGDGAPSAEASA